MKHHLPTLLFARRSSCLGALLSLALLTGCGSDPDNGNNDTSVVDASGDISTADSTKPTDGGTADVLEDASTDASEPDVDDDIAKDTGGDGSSPDTSDNDAVEDIETDLLEDVLEDASADVSPEDVNSDASEDIAEDIEEDTAIPLLPCEPECSEGEVCADGLCLKDCGPGFDAVALKQSLADDLSIVSSVCTTEPHSFVPLSATSFLELTLESSSPTSYMYVHQVDYADDSQPSATFLSSSELPGSLDGFEVFPNDYLATDVFNEIAIFGYVGSFAQGMNGKVFLADLLQPGGLPTPIDAPGHFQATVIDSTTLLVNGQGVGGVNQGPGIYRVKVVEGQTSVAKAATNLGIGGGVVSVHGTVVLLSGHADPWPTECNGVPVVTTVQGTRVFAVDLGTLHAAADAGTPIDAFCDMEKLALPSELTFHPGGDVLGRDVESGNYLSRYSLTKIANGKVFVTASKKLAVGPSVSGGRGVVGTNFVALSHAHGYLIVE